jgi:glycosyltransferase involved in cell wall biosynthesis
MPWLSVVTVVKDDVDGFARSMASLREQDLSEVEWVVIDGSSDAQAIPALLAQDGAPSAVYRYEAPSGIYPAMNTALDVASGDVVYFLNAGDALATSSVLARVREHLGDAVWGFGPVEIEEASGSVIVTPPWDYEAEKRTGFSRGLFPPHQGTFARTSVLLGIGRFDTSYRIAADYAAALRLSQLADPVELPFVIARFREGGTSTVRWQESFREFHRARREILRPSGASALRERWETLRHYALVYAHREVRPRISWLARRTT